MRARTQPSMSFTATCTRASGRFTAMPETLFRAALREALLEEMERDETIFLIGEDIGLFGGAYRVTDGLLDRFGPMRVVDTPIAEEVIVGCDLVAAMSG